MAIGEETPITGRAFKAWQHKLFRHGPRRLGEVVRAGNQLRALTGSRKKRR